MSDELQEQPDHVERMYSELQAAIFRELLVAPLALSKGNLDTFMRAWLEKNSVTLSKQGSKSCAYWYNITHLCTQ